MTMSMGTARMQESEDHVRSPRTVVQHSHRLEATLVAALSFLASCLLFLPILRTFFLFDDLPMIASVQASGGVLSFDWLAPLSNGFWRPTNKLLFLVLVRFFETSPFLSHLMMLLLHSLVCLLTFRAALLICPESRAFHHLAPVFLLLNVATWPAVSMLANSAELTLALGLLLGVCTLERQLRGDIRRFRFIIGLLASLALCLTSKETAIMLPVVLLLWYLARGKRDTRAMRGIAVSSLVFIAYLAISLWAQWRGGDSYVAEGRVSLAPKLVLRQALDYGISLFFPYLHVLELPGRPLLLSNSTLWGLRLLTLAIATVSAWWLWSRGEKRGRQVLALFAMALAMTAPCWLLRDAPQGRFLYAGLPFVSLGVAMLLTAPTFKQRLRRRWCVATLVLFAFLVPGFWFSGTIRGHASTSAQVEGFVNEMSRHADQWPEGSIIAIANHPHPGPPEFRWVYCQLLFNIFHGEKNWQLRLNADDPQATVRLRWDEQHKVLLPMDE